MSYLEGMGESFFSTIVSQGRGVVVSAAHRAVPGPDDGVGDHHGDVVGVWPSAALDGNSDMGEGHTVVTNTDVRSWKYQLTVQKRLPNSYQILDLTGESALEIKRDLSIVFIGDLAEMFGGQFAEVVMVDSSSTGKDHSGSFVVGLDVVNEVVSADGPDVLGGAEDGTAKRSSLVGNWVQMIEYNLLQVHFDFLHFTENDTPFSLNFL